jgi:hypothetical protein
VLAKKARNDLHAYVDDANTAKLVLTCNRIKVKKASGFQKAPLFYKVMQVLESHHFGLNVCLFVLNLFDKRVLRQIVLDEEEDESTSESESSDDEQDNGMPGFQTG